MVAVWVGLFVVGPAAGDDKKPPKPADMIEALANKNKPPEVVMIGDGPEGTVAVFPRDHNWKEEKRVEQAIVEIVRDERIEVWDEMLKATGDKRYCLTCRDGHLMNAKHRTVGSLCSEMAFDRLHTVYRQHLPMDPNGAHRLVPLSLGMGPFDEWRKKRKEKAFYELQIEVCELAVAALAKVDGLPRKKKDAATAAIKDEIEKLRSSKKPIMPRPVALFEDSINPYSASEAERDRKRVAQRSKDAERKDRKK